MFFGTDANGNAVRLGGSAHNAEVLHFLLSRSASASPMTEKRGALLSGHKHP